MDKLLVYYFIPLWLVNSLMSHDRGGISGITFTVLHTDVPPRDATVRVT